MIFVLNTYLELAGGDTAGLVSATESVQLGSQKFLAAEGLDDDVQTGQDGVGLGQEVAVGHQLGLRNAGELGELSLVFGVSLDEAVETCRMLEIYSHIFQWNT